MVVEGKIAVAWRRAGKGALAGAGRDGDVGRVLYSGGRRRRHVGRLVQTRRFSGTVLRGGMVISGGLVTEEYVVCVEGRVDKS